ncbi:MAG: cation:proton antiporter [Alphaproteobacteria bacterium]|nr:cation:proton antiporter [Alphaproteobacteria bacterium]
MHGSEEFSIWEYSAIIFVVVLVSKLISKKTGTVDVLWLIVAGAVLTNAGLLPKHNEFLETIGEWGIVFIMFALGLEEDLGRFAQGLKRSIGIALIGAAFPFVAGYGTATLFGYGHNSAMLWGLTMTATAVSLTMMSLRSDRMHRSTAATGIMTAAVIDDVLSLVGVAILIPIILVSSAGDSAGGATFGGIVWILGKVIIFFAITLFMGLVAFPERVPKEIPAQANLYQKVNHMFSRALAAMGVRRFLMVHSGEFTPLIMLFIAMFLGVIAFELGFHPAIGAYFAGLFLHSDYFIHTKKKKITNEEGEIVETEVKDQTFEGAMHVIEHLSFTIFGPIFFVNLGGKLVFDLDVMVQALPAVAALFTAVVLLQVTSACLAARYTGGYRWHEGVMIGLGMLGRAELAFIVINIAFVQHKIIDVSQFYTLMFTAFLLNVTVPISLKWWKPYYLGFKQLSLFGVTLSRPEPAPVPQDMPEYSEMMAEERRRYLPDS